MCVQRGCQTYELVTELQNVFHITYEIRVFLENIDAYQCLHVSAAFYVVNALS